MRSRLAIRISRLLPALAGLAGIVAVYRYWLHVNPTTVALTLLLYLLLLAAKSSVRSVVAVSLAATVCYNFFFLPPVGKLTIEDPQNWLALLVFLATAVVAGRLSQRARDEAEQAQGRQRELSVLFSLSRELLQTENFAALTRSLPGRIRRACAADSVVLYLVEGDRAEWAGDADSFDAAEHRELASKLSGPRVEGAETFLPLRMGGEPCGLLTLRGLTISDETLEAIAGVVSLALDRAQALEDVARSEAGKESERLRALILDSITHELRTPLTSIKGAASTLLSLQNLDEDARRELLTIVDEESDRLNRLVGQAVEMAQIEARELHMRFAPMMLEELVAQARESCPWVFTTHPVSVQVAGVPAVLADEEMMGKVLCNLLENAAKYSAAGSPIALTAHYSQGVVLTSVADHGPGIDPLEQGLIFDRLYRSSTQRGKTQGTGMGLSISRAIVQSHDGQLTVTSEPGQGSMFTFSLPVAP